MFKKKDVHTQSTADKAHIYTYCIRTNVRTSRKGDHETMKQGVVLTTATSAAAKTAAPRSKRNAQGHLLD